MYGVKFVWALAIVSVAIGRLNSQPSGSFAMEIDQAAMCDRYDLCMTANESVETQVTHCKYLRTNEQTIDQAATNLSTKYTQFYFRSIFFSLCRMIIIKSNCKHLTLKYYSLRSAINSTGRLLSFLLVFCSYWYEAQNILYFFPFNLWGLFYVSFSIQITKNKLQLFYDDQQIWSATLVSLNKTFKLAVARQRLLPIWTIFKTNRSRIYIMNNML